MSTITLEDIQRDPAAFLARVKAGESMVVLGDQQPLAEVRALPRKSNELRPYALAAGEFQVPADFDDPLPEHILKEFLGQ